MNFSRKGLKGLIGVTGGLLAVKLLFLLNYVLLFGLGLIQFKYEVPGRSSGSISIIGGADGPTSIFLAGKVWPVGMWPEWLRFLCFLTEMILYAVLLIKAWKALRKDGKRAENLQ